ncbi:hypothetical protein BB560_003973 [Smittium megazygosporum]|uniref:Prefoldin subunit 5 n=1 Tax=Smittium megazygosporum TaxID=133381 RepID=A0A2T9ZAJ1_9FUNG|nr:hypothetical protein BB560_003973 [Smittium megazygosporum]
MATTSTSTSTPTPSPSPPVLKLEDLSLQQLVSIRERFEGDVNQLAQLGSLSDADSFLVDVGTGYFVSKSASQASKFYDSKIDYIQQNASKLLKSIDEKKLQLQDLNDYILEKSSTQEKS